MASIYRKKNYWGRRIVVMLSDEIKKVPINDQKLSQMKKLIISIERQNLRTGEYATQDMVKAIRKIIEKNAD